MLFHFDRRKKSEKEKKPPRFLVLRRKWLTLGAAVLAAAAIFAAVNYPAAVSASAATRQLPIYCVQRDQKVCSISFDAAWGADNTQKILDVLKEYGVTCTFFVVGNWADQYPEQAKAIVDEGVKTYLVDYQRELEVSQNDEYIQKLADAGMEITYVTPENKALFAEKVAPMYDDAAEQFGQDVMDAVAPYRGQ